MPQCTLPATPASLFETRKQTPTHLFVLSSLQAAHRAHSPPPLKTRRKKVCSQHPSSESPPAHAISCATATLGMRPGQYFTFSGCRFGSCPLIPSRKRGKTDCQSCLRHKEGCVHFMIPGGRDLASSVSLCYCHTPHCTQQSNPVFSRQGNRLQDTAPAQTGKGSNKLHVCIPDTSFMKIKGQTDTLGI